MRTILSFVLHLQLAGTVLAGSGGSFTENKGQWPSHVGFRAAFPGHAVFVEHNAWTVVARSAGTNDQVHRADGTSEMQPTQHHAYRIRFVDATGPSPRGADPVSGVEHFLLGNDPAKWGSNAQRYEELGASDLYPGIDLRMSADGSFKYELLVRPGASHDAIQLQYEGQDDLSLQNGQLLIHASVGVITEEAPFAYQEQEGMRTIVQCAYALDGDRLRFVFPQGYDRSLALVIDPSLVFSTYSGSTSDNFAFGATYDASGHLYVSSIAFGMGYPTTLGAYQTTWVGATADIAITKFAPDGSSLLWSTYFGGTGAECPLAMAVNGADEIFLLALTGSADNPTTAGAHDQTFHGGPAYSPQGLGIAFPEGHDLALARLSADGGSLIAGTYIGGSGGDGANIIEPLAHNYGDNFRSGLVLDATGDPVVATVTSSIDLPVANAPQATNAGGQDAYVFRMNADLDALPWATYLGGSGDDAGYSLCLNGAGEVLVAGGTTSAHLRIPAPAFNATFGGIADGFVARYASGGALLSSTYLGTASYDQAYFVDTDPSGAVMVFGQSEGGYPVTPGLYSSPGGRMFLQLLAADLSAGEWSTEFGNGTNIAPVAFGVDLSGRILFSGFADAIMGGGGSTIGLPITPDAFQSATDGHDFYIMVLEPGAVALEYATYLGGAISYEHTEGASGAIDDHGDLYLAVCAGCGGGNDDFPTTAGAWSATSNSFNCNLAAVKFTTDGTTGIAGQQATERPFVWPTMAEAVVHVSDCEDPPCEVMITDATGRIVLRTTLNAMSTEIAVDRFAPGAYQVRMGAGVQVRQARFIVP